MSFFNNGYIGNSMSVRAAEAYSCGEKPLSKWKKSDIFSEFAECLPERFTAEEINTFKTYPLAALKAVFLKKTSWHHTGKFFNETDFYGIDELDGWSYELIIEQLNRAKQKKPAPVESAEKWECKFLEWSGTRKHPKAVEVTETGTIKGNWFFREDGTKKSVTAKGFKKIRKI